MPNRIRPGARGHNVVIDDDLWAALGKAARQQDTDRAKVLNAAAARYVKRHLPPDQWPASIQPVSRNQRFIQHAQADVDQWKANQQEEQ